jgi:hypothetical protein
VHGYGCEIGEAKESEEDSEEGYRGRGFLELAGGWLGMSETVMSREESMRGFYELH